MRVIAMTPEQINQLPSAERSRIIQLVRIFYFHAREYRFADVRESESDSWS
jgi:Transcription termination and cleavage factor C-terminal